MLLCLEMRKGGLGHKYFNVMLLCRMLNTTRIDLLNFGPNSTQRVQESVLGLQFTFIK